MSVAEDVTFLSSKEAAEFLRLKESTMRQWRCEGTGPSWGRAGAKVLYRKSDLIKYVEKKK